MRPVALGRVNPERRMLLVHAHPDDETIATGATMAKYAAEGTVVSLVTCTLGEEGEVLVPELAHLAAHNEDTLGKYRIAELAAACAALGVQDQRFLGGPGRWRDSGMQGMPSNQRAEAFCNADEDEVLAQMVAVIRELRPQVVVTYDHTGGYGHPDHIRAHQVTVAAFDQAGDPRRFPEAGEPWQPAKLYYSVFPKSVLQQGIDLFREQGQHTDFFGDEVTSADQVDMGVPDEVVTTRIDASGYYDAKMDAMRAHRTQIEVDGPFFALADHAGRTAFGTEYYQLARGSLGPRQPPDDRETDLFAGLD
jgi:N-acetyl-1-D-myo-inositol-2-amino-2-deoxy-alpha-D-glucopyranoside deacetylase